jgi:hypothetical protein
VARSAQHEVHVEQNHHGIGFLCTLRQKFQLNGIRMGSGTCIFSVLFPLEVAPFTATTVQCRGFDTFYGKNGQYNTNPSF